MCQRVSKKNTLKQPSCNSSMNLNFIETKKETTVFWENEYQAKLRYKSKTIQKILFKLRSRNTSKNLITIIE